jgi:UDP-N-acetylmuramate dehydrogenase
MQKANDTVVEREKRHLQNVACAGSYFMNPVAPRWVVEQFESEQKTTSRGGRVPAGWLIEKVGMKGATHGGACASPMHPNYIMNTGAATAQDVVALGENISEKIRTEYMTHMFEEVTKVGL